MTATIIPMQTVDLVREYQSLPPKSRGRKVLERIIARQKRERLEAEVAARKAEVRRAGLISHILTCTAEMMRDLEAEIDAEFALSQSGKEG